MLIRSTLVVVIVCSLLILFLSIWPGLLADIVLIAILFSIIWVPILLVAIAVTTFIMYRRRRKGASRPFPPRQAVAIPVVIVVTLALLRMHAPQRIAFTLSRPAFDAAISSVPTSEHVGIPANLRFGVYKVDEYAADPRGGVFFRVHRGHDGIGPDIISYGFVFKPNRHGTPFGAASYATRHLAGDWYWFRASDDWY